MAAVTCPLSQEKNSNWSAPPAANPAFPPGQIAASLAETRFCLGQLPVDMFADAVHAGAIELESGLALVFKLYDLGLDAFDLVYCGLYHARNFLKERVQVK